MLNRPIVYVAGYPRSGNTFIEVVLNRIFNGIVISNHNHSVEYLTNRLGNNLIVPVRNPLDSISSWVTFRKHEGVIVKIEDCIDHYIDYLKNVNNNMSQICVLNFDKFKNDISYIKNKVYKYCGNIFDKEINLEKVNLEMKNHYQMFSPDRNLAVADNGMKKNVLESKNYKQAQFIFEEVLSNV
jgi:hypothetical protein